MFRETIYEIPCRIKKFNVDITLLCSDLLKFRLYNFFLIRSNKNSEYSELQIGYVMEIKGCSPFSCVLSNPNTLWTPSTCYFGSICEYNNLEIMFENFHTYLKMSEMWSNLVS